ncbi:hypothetical protein N7532_007480 [Penicillium argentinense]|uniref:BHLH domain-containing protein n=1 Tax=Penicillium argentinense TaxID=1131581 RepID=A0A9W9K6S3_9EURO|nr:uncharacterized protein N7532_007480 [Penicillium argentinense]KAJ5095189.1 hypothetical protein N7532_007480 [Penicillium argentinense]
MEQQPAMSWPEQMHETTLIPAPGEDEFSNFLEFNMHFSDLEGHGPAHAQLQGQQMVAPTTSADMPADPRQFSSMEGLAMDFNGHAPVTSHPQQPGHAHRPAHPDPMPYSTPSMTPGFCAQDSSQPAANQPYMQRQPMIPPTPNSMELHGDAARYSHRVDDNADMYDRYSRINEEQALYTPLVSPAMTPLENQFRLPEYTIPGEYFTPLTSPALEAQNAHPSNNAYAYHARQVSDVGFVPTSAEVNPLPGTSAPPSPSIIRKTNRRRGSTAATSRLPGRSKVKQSPSIRAQTQTQRARGKPTPNSEEFYNSLTQELNRPQNNDVRSLQASSNEGSGQDSSPAIAPQPAQSPGTAATPATLMRIQRSQHAHDTSGQFGGAQLEAHDEIMEDILLPEAAAPAVQSRPKVNRIETSIRTSAASPVISANVTPSLEPRSAAERTPGSIALSPRTVAMPSPSGPVPKRSDTSRASVSSISNRKRPSMSSTQASPQLRPKISPSIQPLMRGGENLTQDALYLASKSNYQHILDGTLPSGVSYPETLAENLSSKRTNHKLAEQGRRNRINSALKEIETLIPPEFIQARQAKEASLGVVKPNDKEKEKPANQAISKASAVEMAIDYIKALKMTLDQTATKLAAAEAKLAQVSLDDKPQADKDKDVETTATEKTINGASTAADGSGSS